MNAFRYTANEETPKKTVSFPLISRVIAKGGRSLINLGNVLAAHKRTFSDYSKIIA